MIPNRQIQRIKSIVDTMHAAATAIFNEKKSALRAGDEVVMKQIGEGKDIMSILSEFCMIRVSMPTDSDSTGPCFQCERT